MQKNREDHQHLMAIDAGTGSVRAVIFNIKGEQISVGQREWTHQPVSGSEGSMDFDLENNWELICQCTQQAISQAQIPVDSIVGVSSCSMREGIVVYDKEKKPIWACANVDARAGKQVVHLKSLQDGAFEENIYHLTGQTLALGALARLTWLKDNRYDIYNNIDSISMISDWVGYKLCDKIAVDPSNAGTTGMLNLHSRQWDSNILSEAGLNSDILPPVLETGSVLGKITAKAAIESGLCEGTPFVMGGGDVQLGCLGLGIVRPHQTAILGGTFWQQVVNLPEAMTDPDMNVRINPHVIPGMVQAESISFFTGLTMRWFRDAFCGEEKLVAERLGKDVYTLLEDMARNVPCGSHGVMPIFSDAMHFKTWYHAAPSFINLSIDPEKCNKPTLFRSLEENASIVSSCNLEQVFEFSKAHPDHIVFAGGASKGTLWSQILADVTGMEVRVPVVKEATALGCAIAAGVGTGIYSDLISAGEKLVEWETSYYPNTENTEIYQELKSKWLSIYKEQLHLVDDGLTTSLWKATGL
ncbi:autoinducer-2 kinase [Vibrio sp. VB16]|uniref:autoinducer-2 kinase n=1 Tax=Vibrio sp. VB16 TaxID=2785746 RepID=UPI001E3DD361|nr:autoinducer-2 kinase [Vibrio sp. VB16]UGA57499.1 autoinducer-2 kinase [Vibrio sp. VB16]